MSTDTEQRPARARRAQGFPTLEAFQEQVSDDRMEEYRRAIKERLGFDPMRERERKIGLAEATRLAGVLPGTGTQWRRRTARGTLRKPFPQPLPNSPTMKPLYDPFQIAAWLDWTGKWPPESAARPEMRTVLPGETA